MKKYSKIYPELFTLFSGYFNQDWDEDFESPKDVISKFARDGDKKEIENTIIELQILLKENHTFQEWEDILYNNFGCEYYFDYVNDYSPKEFFEKVLKQLENELILAKKESRE